MQRCLINWKIKYCSAKMVLNARYNPLDNTMSREAMRLTLPLKRSLGSLISIGPSSFVSLEETLRQELFSAIQRDS